jgi:hypothetical protein
MLLSLESAVIDEAAAARRTAVYQHGEAAMIGLGDFQRSLCAVDEHLCDIPAGTLPDAGFSRQNIFTRRAIRDFGGRPGDTQAGGEFRTYEDKSTFILPFYQGRVRTSLIRTVVTDPTAEKAGAYKDFVAKRLGTDAQICPPNTIGLFSSS